MASWGGNNTAVLAERPAGGRIPPQAASKRRLTIAPLVAADDDNGARCCELRITDESATWRIIYRTDPDAVVIVEVFSKKTRQTPKKIIQTCKTRLKDYDA